MARQAVIETATGDLLRVGYCDFESDGAFDATVETIHNDPPTPAFTRSRPGPSGFHRWDGASWVLVSVSASVKEAIYRTKSIHGNIAIPVDDEIQYTRVRVLPGTYNQIRLLLENAKRDFTIYTAVFTASGGGVGSKLTTGSLAVIQDTAPGSLEVDLLADVVALGVRDYWIAVLIVGAGKSKLVSTLQAFGRESDDVQFEDGSSIPDVPNPDEDKRAAVFYASLLGT